MIKLAALLLLVLASFFVVHPAHALYFFGGKIVAIAPPAPYGPCSSASIFVVGPRPGVFMLPPGILYAYRAIHVGALVLGSATQAQCGTIFYMGTSY